jgi:hypothetical protein
MISFESVRFEYHDLSRRAKASRQLEASCNFHFPAERISRSHRVFKHTDGGELSLASFSPNGAPWLIRKFVSAVGFLASPPMRGPLRLALRAQPEVGA